MLGENGWHFAGDISKCLFLNEKAWILVKILLMSVPKFEIDNIPALVQLMDWHQPRKKPLSELMMIILLMHMCVTQP